MNIFNKKKSEHGDMVAVPNQPDASHSADDILKIILDAAPIGCMLMNADFEILYCNQTCITQFQLTTQENLFECFFALSPDYQNNGEPSKELAMTLLNNALKNKKHSFEWMHRKTDLTLMPCEITLIRVLYQNEPCVAVFVRDVSEQKKVAEENEKLLSDLKESAAMLEVSMQEATSANEAKSAFLANMSHEMRTPLNVIIGLTELHLDVPEETPDEVSLDLQKINTAGTALLGIVNDVLDISKIESGKLELVPEQYVTASLINNIITLNILRIESKPIKFIIDVDPNLPYTLIGDELRLSQVFNNLLSNAFKYTMQGSVHLTVGFERGYDDDVWLDIVVADSGIGMRSDALHDLFKEYYQLDVKANRKIEGTGLGLSIAKRLVKMMDGEIYVESEYGKGSTFTVRLKQTYVNNTSIGPEIVQSLKHFTYKDIQGETSQKIIRKSKSHAHVLIVDDFQANLDVAAGMIRKYKIHVDTVTSGKDAIEAINRGVPRYDAVFMDHMMPEMDGIEATKCIRALDSEYAKNLPVIALTANAIIGSEKIFIDHGFQAFLSKPIDIMKLDAVINKWIPGDDAEDGAPQAVLADEPHHETWHIHIEGVDSTKALQLYGNDLELYDSIIQSYARNTPALLTELSHLSEDNLRNYAIHVHSLKAASANIGANEVSAAALELEMLAKAGDYAHVKEKNPVLIAQTKALLVCIAAWQNEKPKIVPENTICLDEDFLQEMIECCKNYDMHGLDELLAKLSQYNEPSEHPVIENIERLAVSSEFDALQELLTKQLASAKGRLSA